MHEELEAEAVEGEGDGELLPLPLLLLPPLPPRPGCGRPRRPALPTSLACPTRTPQTTRRGSAWRASSTGTRGWGPPPCAASRWGWTATTAATGGWDVSGGVAELGGLRVQPRRAAVCARLESRRGTLGAPSPPVPRRCPTRPPSSPPFLAAPPALPAQATLASCWWRTRAASASAPSPPSSSWTRWAGVGAGAEVGRWACWACDACAEASQLGSHPRMPAVQTPMPPPPSRPTAHGAAEQARPARALAVPLAAQEVRSHQRAPGGTGARLCDLGYWPAVLWAGGCRTCAHAGPCSWQRQPARPVPRSPALLALTDRAGTHTRLLRPPAPPCAPHAAAPGLPAGRDPAPAAPGAGPAAGGAGGAGGAAGQRGAGGDARQAGGLLGTDAGCGGALGPLPGWLAAHRLGDAWGAGAPAGTPHLPPNHCRTPDSTPPSHRPHLAGGAGCRPVAAAGQAGGRRLRRRALALRVPAGAGRRVLQRGGGPAQGCVPGWGRGGAEDGRAGCRQGAQAEAGGWAAAAPGEHASRARPQALACRAAQLSSHRLLPLSTHSQPTSSRRRRGHDGGTAGRAAARTGGQGGGGRRCRRRRCGGLASRQGRAQGGAGC